MWPARRSVMCKTLTPSLPADTRFPRSNVEKACCLIKVHAPPDQTWRQGPWAVNVLDLENGVWRWLCSWWPWQQVGSWQMRRDSGGTASVATSSALTCCHGKDSGACLFVYSDSYFESQAELNPENLGLSSSSFDCFRVILKRIASNCNTLQHTAKHCNTLQHTATHCNALQHNATQFNTLHKKRLLPSHNNSFVNEFSIPDWPMTVKNHSQERKKRKEAGTRSRLWSVSFVKDIYPPTQTATLCNTLQHTSQYCNTMQHTASHGQRRQRTAIRGKRTMGWLRLVGSLKVQVSFTEYRLFLLQKRPIILRSLLIVATP